MASSHAVRNAEIKYPTGCKEINEDLSTDDLIRRLKDIAMAFQQMSQEDEVIQDYIPLALFLANDFFLDHSSRDVRLLVACSIADVFRVFAPNAPYDTSDSIKRIFLFFIQQLKGLQDPKDATFKRYFYLLENLAWVKSFNICIELDDSQYIFCELFSLIFKIVNDNHSDKVKNFMLDMLTPLITEADTVSTKLLQLIFYQLIEPKKTSNKSAYYIASKIIEKTNQTIEPYIHAYFTKAITRGINENGDVSDGEDNEEDLEELKQKHRKMKNNSNAFTVGQICDLIYEINRIAPNILQGMLSPIEFKLKSSEERERCEYTKLLARIFSDKNSQLSQKFPEVWKSFLGRFRDISVTVRQRCVQYSMHFLLNHPELRDDITEQLKQRQHDADENVRYEVVMAIISAGKKGLENINEALLGFVKERTLDKKFKIRREALYGMAQLYKQYTHHLSNAPDVVSDEVQASLRMLSWIKNKCMHNYYSAQLDDKLLVERIVHTCLVPFSLPLPQRMRALYMFYCSIDLLAARAFNELLKQQQSVRRLMKEVMDILCRSDKSEERDLLLKSKVAAVAKNLTEPVKAEEYINKLCQNMETNLTAKQHMNLIVTSASFIQMTEDGKCIPASSSANIESSVREILKSLGFPVQTNSFYMIIKQLMERIAPIMIDHEGLLMLLNYISDSLIGDGEMDNQMGLRASAVRGLQLILVLSQVFPALFHGSELFNAYLLPFLWQCGDNHHVAELVLQILTNIGGTAFEHDSTEIDHNNSILWWADKDDFVSRLIDKFIINAATSRQAKHAINCLNAIIIEDQKKIQIFGEIIDKIKEQGLSLESTPYFRFHLVALGMIALNGGHVYFPKMLRSIVQKFVVQGLLLKDLRTELEIETLQASEQNRPDTTDLNIIYEHLSTEVKTKVEGFKLLVRWIYGLKLNTLLVVPENQEEATGIYVKAASNAMQLFKTVIQTDGDLNGKGGGTVLEKAFLRLSAALAMLKIASNDALTGHNANNEPIYQKNALTLDVMSPSQWHTLATVLLDNQEFVKEKFLAKLNKGLYSLNLGQEFLAFFTLGGLFENGNFRSKMKNYMTANFAKRRDIVKSRLTPNLKCVMPDCVMPFVIHLLAHMPFYTKYDDIQQLEKVKECLWFIMEPMVLKNELYSFSFFKKTFENIKLCVDRGTSSQVKSSNNDPNAVKLASVINYKIYSICDLALGLVMSKTQNFLLKEYPVTPSLPGKYYTASPDTENNTKIYLPPEMQFAPPKRCGLEAELLGKITKSFPRASSAKPLKGQSKTVSGSNELIDESALVENEPSHRTRRRKTGAAVADNQSTSSDTIAEEESVETSNGLGSTGEQLPKSEYDFEDTNEEEGGPEKAAAAAAAATDVENDEQVEPGQKRNRPTRTAKATTSRTSSETREGSPPRKSARIAHKSPPRPSTSPEPEANRRNLRTRAKAKK